MVLAPLLVFVAMMAWALGSPVASSPDDDFHLVSIWCSSPTSEDFCLPGKDSETRVVPESLVQASCFAYEPEVSAGCQKNLDFTAEPSTMTNRGNFVGAYPPVFYSVMGVFASHDIESSVLVMRTVTVLLFTALITSLYLLLPAERRPALVWSWVLTTVPLGLFILTSNNPSSWTTMGVGFGWLALLGFFETDGKDQLRRKVALGAIFALCAFMAAGSRGDGALYSIVAILAVSVLAFSRSKRFLVESILPIAVAVMCVMMYRFSRPIESVTGGVDSDSTGNFFVTIANNLLHVPSLWLGILGKDWGLGWLDTSMPAAVWVLGLLCFMGVGFIGVKGMSMRRAVVLAGGVLLLALLPAVLLSAAGSDVGTNLQPRYLLPLVVLFAGILTLSSGRLTNRLTVPQWILVATALSSTQLLALHLNMQRYISGIGDQSANLDHDIAWWWHIPLSPMTVWVVGSVAYAALIVIVLHAMRRLPASKPDAFDADEAAVLHG